jgi:hypothetical protein
VVVVGVEGGGEKFSDGEILKTTTVGSLQTTTTTLFSYLGHLYDPTWMRGVRYHPPSPSRKHRRPHIDEQVNVNKRMNEQIYGPSQPPGQSPAEHAVTRRLTAVLTGSWITRHGFPRLLSTEW